MVLSNGIPLTPAKVDLIVKYKGVVNGICLNIPAFEPEVWSLRSGINIKQFDKLIVSYANSILSQRKIHLVILGNGDVQTLKKVAIKNNVADFVHFLGYQNNPFKYLRKAKFLVLSSKNEGFANVLVEALACETPVVSFDCPCGPNAIIIDKVNGVLVENQNLSKLTEAINLMILDDKLYRFCKQNALVSIKPFLLDTIGKQWLELLNIKENTTKI